MTRYEWLVEASKIKTDECVIWPFSKRNTYASVNVGDKTSRDGHRIVCELAHGKPKDGQYAIHSCDKKPCVNPRHIRWAAPSENNREAVARGLAHIGERHPRSKLTKNAVRAARKDRETGMTWKALAKKYGVTQKTIQHAVDRITWRHVK